MIDYDKFALQYDEMVKRGGPRRVYGWILEELERETTGLAGKWICDLGCGQGELADRLERQGAVVTGVDYSEALLRMARSLNDRVSWMRDDAMKLESLPDGSFDIVVSSIMMMDVPDHRAVFQQSRRILKKGGLMLWMIMHPCFQSPFSHPLEDGARKVYQYAPQYWKSHGNGTLRATLGAYHRPLSYYVNDFMQEGFALKRLIEPGCEQAMESVIQYFGAVGYAYSKSLL